MWSQCLVLIVAIVNLSSADDDGGRIYNGTRAELAEFPFMVSLQRSEHKNEMPQKYCGGVILSNIWILTAAHCLDRISDIKLLQVRSGVVRTYDIRGQDVKVAQTYSHPLYSKTDPLARHDIALLRLQAPLVYSKNVQPIKLPSENFEAIGQSGVIIGYGTLGSSQPSNNFNLMKADSKVLALSECRDFYPVITSAQLCIGGTSSSSCAGDSGSPFVINEGGKPVVAGIDSVGGSDCNSSSKSVYTNVQFYLDFIQKIINADH